MMCSILVFVAGCNLRIGESPPENPEILVGGDPRFACMGRIGETIEGFVEGRVTQKETAEFFTCLQHSLRSFTQYMKPVTPNQFRPENLREFLQQFFFSDRLISDSLLWGAMDLKVAVVGGEKTVITLQEIEQTIEILKSLSRISVRIQPLMKAFHPRTSLELSKQERSLDQVEREMLWAVDQFAGLIANSDSRLELDTIIRFINELTQFLRQEKSRSASFPSGVTIWMDLLKPLKALVQPDEPQVLRQKDWQGFLRAKVQWYLVVLRFRAEIRPNFTLASPGRLGLGWTHALRKEYLNELRWFVENIFFLLNQSLQSHPDQTIEMDELRPLLESLERQRIMPFGVSAQAAEAMLRALFRQFFGDLEKLPKQRTIDSLNSRSLTQAKQEFQDWYLVQKYIDKTSLVRMPPSLRSLEIAEEEHDRPVIDIQFREVAREIVWLFVSDRPLFKPGQDTVWMVEDPIWRHSGFTHTFEGLTLKNLFRVVSNALIKGFSADWALRRSPDSGVTSDEMQTAYDAVSALGFELNLMDPRSRGPGHRSFIEAKLFTYLADGLGQNDQLRMDQAIEFFIFLFSGGLTNNRVHQRLTEICGEQYALGPLGIYGDMKLPRSCVIENYFSVFFDFVDSLPGLKSYIAEQPSSRVVELAEIILKSSAPEASSPDLLSSSYWIEKSDVVVMVMITFYVEAVMTRYNLNADQVLDPQEQQLALKTFEGFLSVMMQNLCMTPSESQVQFVFDYILRERKIPTPDQWADYLAFRVSRVFQALPEPGRSSGVWGSGVLDWVRRLDPAPPLQLSRGDMIEILSAVIREVVSAGGESKVCSNQDEEADAPSSRRRRR